MAKQDYNASAADTILEALAKYGGRQKRRAHSIEVVCPFHDDRHPSCSVNISKPTLPIGTFHCWGCDESGPWNKFAKKTNLPEIKNWQSTEITLTNITPEREYELLGVDVEAGKKLSNSLAVDVIQQWQSNKIWRGFEGELLRDIGCKLVIDRKSELPHLLCPVVVNGTTVGALKAVLEKTYSKQLAYITSNGTWVKDKGLFPYDYVKAMLRKKKLKFVILVEGPRDALRLIRDGLPALAILGANNISVKKALLAMSCGSITHVFTMPDNDAGGKKMHKAVKLAFTDLLKVQRFRLPEEYDDNGDLIKIDPCSAPKRIIRNLKNNLRSMGLLT